MGPAVPKPVMVKVQIARPGAARHATAKQNAPARSVAAHVRSAPARPVPSTKTTPRFAGAILREITRFRLGRLLRLRRTEALIPETEVPPAPTDEINSPKGRVARSGPLRGRVTGGGL